MLIHDGTGLITLATWTTMMINKENKRRDNILEVAQKSEVIPQAYI